MLGQAGELIAAVAGGRGFVMTHPAIARLHGPALSTGLAPFDHETIHIPAGERQKSLRRASALWDELVSRGADRQSVIVAFGGGVIGDLAGFVAACYMRGVPYVQIPTTLVAQVDSSVGGKVAVNHPRAKNLIGAFYQPLLVVADVSLLHTLPAREYRQGLAEAVKTALIADPELFQWFEANVAAVARRDESALAHMVRRCCEIKADIVSADERESGRRAVLNFGHTVGHALEALAGYRRLRHGEAVSIGMSAAARVAERLGMFSEAEAERLANLLSSFRLPTRIPGTPISAVLEAMQSDKKTLAGSPRLVLPREIGRVQAGCEVPQSLLREVLAEVRVVN
jgi:3-dehydroquinate synthase